MKKLAFVIVTILVLLLEAAGLDYVFWEPVYTGNYITFSTSSETHLVVASEDSFVQIGCPTFFLIRNEAGEVLYGVKSIHKPLGWPTDQDFFTLPSATPPPLLTQGPWIVEKGEELHFLVIGSPANKITLVTSILSKIVGTILFLFLGVLLLLVGAFLVFRVKKSGT